jgi:hypothetical protein
MSEQIEAFPWDLVSHTLNGRIEFNYHSVVDPSLRKQITWSDARWAVRLIAQLTRAQIEEAVALGHWPDSVGRLLVEKLIHRRNQLVQAFDLVGEATPSGAIALLDVDRHISTADGHVVDGELIDGVFEGATQDFDSYWEEFLGPVWEQVKLAGVGVFQQTIGSVPGLIFDEDSVGLPKGLLIGVYITIKREVEENPIPTGDHDYYLVRDRMLLGLRVGGEFLATATVGYWRSYTLVQPAGTREEAHSIGGTILNVRLPYHVWKDQLPENYVLLRESYYDVRAGATTQWLDGRLPPVGATWTGGAVRISRDVLSQKDGQTLAYQDASNYVDSRLDAWLNLVILRLPLAGASGRTGTLKGRLFVLPTEAVREEPAWSDALSRLIRDGDFSGIEGRTSGLNVHSDFWAADGFAGLFILAGQSTATRNDRVTLTPIPGPAGLSQPAGAEQRFSQYRTGSRGFWAFLDLGENRLQTVTSVTRSDGIRTGWETPQIVSTYFQRDRNTFDDELGEGYLRFVNGIAGEHGPLIEFTPSLHSVNGRWGDIEVGVRVGYSQEGVHRIRSMEAEELFAQLGRDVGVEPWEMRKLRGWMRAQGKGRWMKIRRVPTELRVPIYVTRRVAAKLEQARQEEDPSRWMRHVANALSIASSFRDGSFDPRALGAMHQLLDPEDVSIEVTVEPPPWIENRLMSNVPLVAFTHEKRHALVQPWVEFEPHCSAGIYTMLETMVGEDPVRDRYGAVCDGARGGFNH